MELSLIFRFTDSNTIKFKYDFSEEEICILVEDKDDENDAPKHIESFNYQQVLAIRNFCNEFLEENKHLKRTL